MKHALIAIAACTALSGLFHGAPPSVPTPAAIPLPPVGSIIAWHKSLMGGAILPTGWVECSGGKVDDPESQIDGASIPNLNGNRHFLRGTDGQTGVAQAEQWKSLQMQSVRTKFSATAKKKTSNPQQKEFHALPNYTHAGTVRPGGAWSERVFSGRWASDFPGASGFQLRFNPKDTYEVRPVNTSVAWIMRVR